MFSRTVRLSVSITAKVGSFPGANGGPAGCVPSEICPYITFRRESNACPVTLVEPMALGWRDRIMKLAPPQGERVNIAQPIMAQEPSAAGVTRGSRAGEVVHTSAYIRLRSRSYW